jgi:hypothetical protein
MLGPPAPPDLAALRPPACRSILYRYTASVAGGVFSLLFFLSGLVTLFCVVLTYG